MSSSDSDGFASDRSVVPPSAAIAVYSQLSFVVVVVSCRGPQERVEELQRTAAAAEGRLAEAERERTTLEEEVRRLEEEGAAAAAQLSDEKRELLVCREVDVLYLCDFGCLFFHRALIMCMRSFSPRFISTIVTSLVYIMMAILIFFSTSYADLCNILFHVSVRFVEMDVFWFVG